MFKRGVIYTYLCCDFNSSVLSSRTVIRINIADKPFSSRRGFPWSWQWLHNQNVTNDQISRPACATAALIVEVVSTPSFLGNLIRTCALRQDLKMQDIDFVYFNYICPPSGPGCYAVWCFPCFCCSIASDMDECCLWGSSMPLRSVYRTRYNIKVSFQWMCLCGAGWQCSKPAALFSGHMIVLQFVHTTEQAQLETNF